MKSLRLNDGLRTVIIDNALNSIPALSLHDIEDKQKAFGEKYGMPIYNSMYDRNIQRRMKNMPEGAFARVDTLHFVIEVEVSRDRTSREHLAIPLGKKVPVFACDSGRWGNGAQIPDDIDEKELWAAYQTVEKYQIGRARREKEMQLMQFLKQFTTTKQLAEEWPEGVQFIPKPPTESKALTIRSDSVNKMLGLAK